MYEECERFCKDWESCQMFTKIKKRKRIVKYNKSNAWFERYQADTVELDSRITHNHAYPYLLTIVDHFSKYGFAYAILYKKKKQLGITWHKPLRNLSVWRNVICFSLVVPPDQVHPDSIPHDELHPSTEPIWSESGLG